MIVRCPCGAEPDPDQIPEGSYNVQAAADAMGFLPIMNSMGETVWLCLSCVEEIRPHVAEINRLCPDEFLNWYALTCALKK